MAKKPPFPFKDKLPPAGPSKGKPNPFPPKGKAPGKPPAGPSKGKPNPFKKG